VCLCERETEKARQARFSETWRWKKNKPVAEVQRATFLSRSRCLVLCSSNCYCYMASASSKKNFWCATVQRQYFFLSLLCALFLSVDVDFNSGRMGADAVAKWKFLLNSQSHKNATFLFRGTLVFLLRGPRVLLPRALVLILVKWYIFSQHQRRRRTQLFLIWENLRCMTGTECCKKSHTTLSTQIFHLDLYLLCRQMCRFGDFIKKCQGSVHRKSSRL